MGLLSQAADWFKARETPIECYYRDGHGRYAFAVDVANQRFIVAAKQYLDGGNASFFADKVVQRAIDQEALLLLFLKNHRLVFDPRTVEMIGDHNATQQTDRKRRGEHWIDVTADAGVDFRRWYDGDAAPDAPGDHIDTDDRDRDRDDRPDRPWDIQSYAGPADGDADE